MVNLITETHISNIFAAVILMAFFAALAAEIVNFIPELIHSMIKRIKNKSIIEQNELLTLGQENVLTFDEKKLETNMDRSDLGTNFLKGRFFSK